MGTLLDRAFQAFIQIASKWALSVNLRGVSDNALTSTTIGSKTAIDFYKVNESVESAYGETHNVAQVSSIRSAPTYNFIPANFRIFSVGTGSAGVGGTLFNEYKCSSGTTAGHYGALQSFRSVNAEQGRGLGSRFAARFPTNTVNTWQGVGLLTVGDEISFGYNGTNFGVWHRYGGIAEVRTFTITVAAAGAETATVNLNSVAYSIPLTAGTTAFNAKQVADYLTTNATTYNTQQIGSTVVVISLSDGAKSGTWSFSSTGAATATIVRTTTGVAKTDSFVNQADFNGEVPSNFDPTKGNIYECKVQGGYGNLLYYILDPSTSRFLLAHTIRNLSSIQQANLRNPSLRVGMYSTSIGTTTNVDVYCSSFDGFVENGSDSQTRNPRAYRNTKTVSATTQTNLFTIRNRNVFNGFSNQAEIVPLQLSISSESTKTVYIDIRTNPTVGGNEDYQEIGTNLISLVDTAGTTVSAGTLLCSFVLRANGSEVIDLTPFKIRVPPTLRLNISAYITGGAASDISASLTWVEEI